MGSGTGGSGGGGGAKGVAGGGAPTAPTRQLPAEQLGKTDTENIYAYTGGDVPGGDRFAHLNAEQLNKMHWDPNTPLTAEGANYTKILNKSLDNVVDSPGTSYRLVEPLAVSGTVQELNDFATQYVPGKVSTFNEFLSTSRVKDAVNFDYAHPNPYSVRFKVEGKHGKDISKISRFGDEIETLFKTKSSFMIKSRDWNPDLSTWDIVMTEV